MIPLSEEHDRGLDLKHLHFLAGSSSDAGVLGSPTAMQAQLQRWCFVRWPWKQTHAHRQANTAAELFASEKHNLNISICVYVISHIYKFF